VYLGGEEKEKERDAGDLRNPLHTNERRAIGSEGAKEGEGGQRGEMREKEKAFVM